MSALDDLIGQLGDLLTTAVPLTPDQQAALVRYGGYQLVRGDHDAAQSPVYEGQARTAPAQLPAPGDDGYVTVLQKDLAQLGFMPAVPADGQFGAPTSWLIREFQTYAGMETAATLDQDAAPTTPLGDRLLPVANAARYTGAITGRLDGATALALQAWRANGYTCPVVVEGRDQNGVLVHDNLWKDDPATGLIVWVTDVTGTYAIDPARIDAQGPAGNPVGPSGPHPRVRIGSWTTQGTLSGPICAKGSLWHNIPAGAGPDVVPQGTDITVSSLTGVAGPPSAATLSTYKVIRAVAHVESGDNFDGVNSWDRARVSFGPYHFALFVQGARTELPAFLSFLAAQVPEFDVIFARYGFEVASAWPTDGTGPMDPGNQLWDHSQRKWTGFLTQAGLPSGTGTVSMAQKNLTVAGEADYFRTWHWFYRWVMICRMFPEIWPAAWTLCRYRIQALLAAPVPAESGLPAGVRLGQVFNSEYSVAALLRAHVNEPAAVIDNGHASPTVITGLRNALTNRADLLTEWPNWTDEQHRYVDGELVSALLFKANDVNPGQDPPKRWPYADDLMIALEYVSDAGSAVSLAAGSFQLDPP